MRRTGIRWLIFLGLAGFFPLFYYLAVVGGFLPYGAILLIGVRHLTDASFLMFSVIHLAVYGLLLYWLSGLIARALIKATGNHAWNLWMATAIVMVLLAGVGVLPIYGVAHGQIQWVNAYQLYSSGKLK